VSAGSGNNPISSAVAVYSDEAHVLADITFLESVYVYFSVIAGILLLPMIMFLL
jgi:hypothetical protein